MVMANARSSKGEMMAFGYQDDGTRRLFHADATQAVFPFPVPDVSAFLPSSVGIVQEAEAVASAALSDGPDDDEDVDEDVGPGSYVDHILAPELDAVVDTMLYDAENASQLGLTWLSDYTVRCLWYRKGGKTNGAPVFVKTAMFPRLARVYLGLYAIRFPHFVIIASAKHCRESAMERWRVEGMIYHSLLRARLGPTGELGLRSPDVQLFGRELEQGYGDWSPKYQEAIAAAKQLPLWPVRSEKPGGDR